MHAQIQQRVYSSDILMLNDSKGWFDRHDSTRMIFARWTVPSWHELVHSTHSSTNVIHLMLTPISFLFL